MPCHSPRAAWRLPSSRGGGVTFERNRGISEQGRASINIPCGQCMACRLERSRQWAVRCLHESKLHQENAFITLTYDAASLPNPPSLDVRHWQLFMKRLKERNGGKSIRFFMGAEYGEKNRRPHYHALLFGHDFHDKRIHSFNQRQEPIFVSQSLTDTWQLGYASVAAVTFESAAYVARYATKKITGDAAKDHYAYVDDSGEVHQLRPEFSTQSRRPGIGIPWLRKYFNDVYPSDEVIVRGKACRPPRAYDKLHESWFKFEYDRLKEDRAQNAPKPENTAESVLAYYGIGFGDNAPQRLDARREVLSSRVSNLKRTI